MPSRNVLRFMPALERWHGSRPFRWALHAADLGHDQHRLYRQPFNEPACIVVRGTLSRARPTQGPKRLSHRLAPVSSALTRLALSEPPTGLNRSRWLLRKKLCTRTCTSKQVLLDNFN